MTDLLVSVADLAEELHGLTVTYRNEYRGWENPVQAEDRYSWSEIRGHYSDHEGSPEHGIVMIDQAAWGEYNNTGTYNRANFEALQEDYPETFLTVGMSGHDGQTLALPLAGMITEDVADILRGLDDYPIYDEDRMAKIEMEIEQDAWGSWVEWDLTRDLETYFETAKGLGCDWATAEFHWNEMDRQEVFRNALDFTNTYPVFESSDSCTYHDFEHVVGEVAVQILSHRERELRSSFV